MADNEISVELVAKTEALDTGLAEAIHAVREAVDSMHVAFSLGFHGLQETIKNEMGAVEKEVSEKSESIKEILEKTLHLEQINVGIEMFKMGMEGIKEAFEATAGAAEEFGLSNAKFAAIMHTSEEDAAGLAAALRGVGEDTGTYESIAVRLQQRLEQGTGINKDLLDSFKDQNGQVLQGQALMDRLGEVLGKYTEQGQTAVVVQLGLGRRIQDVTSALRVHEDAIKHQEEIYQSLGVNISGTSQTAQKFEEAVNDVKTMFQAFGIALGQSFLPIFTQTMESMAGPGMAALKGIAEAVKFVYYVFDVLASGVATAVRSIVLVLQELWDTLKTGGKLLVDIMKGDFNAFIEDFDKGLTEGVKDAKAAGQDIVRYWKENDEVFDSLFGEKKPKPEANVFKLPTGTQAAPPRPTHQKRDNTDRDELEADEKIALERVKREEEVNQHLLAMGKETNDEFLAQARQLENDTYNVKLETLNKEMLLPNRTAEEQLKINNQIRELEEQHQTALLKIDEDGEKRRAELAKRRVESFLQSLDDELKVATENDAKLYELGQLTAAQRYRADADLTASIEHAELARLDEQIATLKKGTDAYEQAISQRKKIEDKFREDSAKNEKKLRDDTLKDVQARVRPMEEAFNGAFKGMLLQGKSFQDAMQGLWEGLAGSFIDMILKMAEEWAEKQIANAIIGETVGGAEARTQIAASAAAAGAAAYAATVGIPIVGLAAAPAAAAAAYGQTIAYEAFVPSAAGGMVVDKDQLAMVHEKEMVLPAHLSDGIQKMIAGGSGGGNSSNYHFPTTINGGGGPDVLQALQKQPRVLAAMIKQLQRDGTL